MAVFGAYELRDFGAGRKLERFGAFLLDRPSPPAAEHAKAEPAQWRQASARFERSGGERGHWRPAAALPAAWTLDCLNFRLELRPTPFGHLGIFPEQFENWCWLQRQIARRDPPPRILNLFAYTGGSTLAAAAAGASVVHVDAARTAVRWARANAERSQLAAAPIRWIVDDVRKYVAREIRRGSRYDAVILDPPSYGHGPGAEAWKTSQHLLPLLRACAELTRGEPAFVLLTCHSAGWGAAELAAILADTLVGHCRAAVTARSLSLATADGRTLPAGAVARLGRGT